MLALGPGSLHRISGVASSSWSWNCVNDAGQELLSFFIAYPATPGIRRGAFSWPLDIILNLRAGPAIDYIMMRQRDRKLCVDACSSEEGC